MRRMWHLQLTARSTYLVHHPCHVAIPDAFDLSQDSVHDVSILAISVRAAAPTLLYTLEILINMEELQSNSENATEMTAESLSRSC